MLCNTLAYWADSWLKQKMKRCPWIGRAGNRRSQSWRFSELIPLWNLYFNICWVQLQSSAATNWHCHQPALPTLCTITIGHYHYWTLSLLDTITIGHYHYWTLSLLYTITIGHCQIQTLPLMGTSNIRHEHLWALPPSIITTIGQYYHQSQALQALPLSSTTTIGNK